MSKQLLIYETAIPVSAARHGGASFDPTNNYAFSAGINAVPGSYSFTGTDISVVVASPTVFFTNTATDQISITGDGDLFFESQGTVILFSDGGIGVDILNYGAGSPGTVGQRPCWSATGVTSERRRARKSTTSS